MTVPHIGAVTYVFWSTTYDTAAIVRIVTFVGVCHISSLHICNTMQRIGSSTNILKRVFLF